MPHQQNFKTSAALSSAALAWKNSLLTKEVPENLQSPTVFFGKVVHDNDTFSILYEQINSRRERGEELPFEDTEDMQVKRLHAFVVVQDPRGVNWICPINAHADPIDHRICPLDLGTDENALPYRTMESFGEVTMTQNDFWSACSRGFENASKVLLGQESIRLDQGLRLVACYFLYQMGND